MPGGAVHAPSRARRTTPATPSASNAGGRRVTMRTSIPSALCPGYSMRVPRAPNWRSTSRRNSRKEGGASVVSRSTGSRGATAQARVPITDAAYQSERCISAMRRCSGSDRPVSSRQRTTRTARSSSSGRAAIRATSAKRPSQETRSMRHAGRYGGCSISACRQPAISTPASSAAVTGGSTGASVSATGSGPATSRHTFSLYDHMTAAPATTAASARKRPTFGRLRRASGAATRRMAGSSASAEGSTPATSPSTRPGVTWSVQPTPRARANASSAEARSGNTSSPSARIAPSRAFTSARRPSVASTSAIQKGAAICACSDAARLGQLPGFSSSAA